MNKFRNKGSNNLKRFVTALMAMMMLVTSVPLDVIAEVAEPIASTPSVEIVSFTRGAVADIRNSELMEARVTGYDGNIQDLYFVWKNGLGTYLYIYNTHNMYGVEDTTGEVSIYKGTQSSYKKGFAWAAIYGANYSMDNMVGTITVEVYERTKNNKYTLLCSDTHTGTREGKKNNYIYKGFIEDNIGEDIQDVSFGIFEGETREIRDLLGESSIVHISCTACNLGQVTLESGNEYISLQTLSGSKINYNIKGLKPGTNNDGNGDAKLSYTIAKANCKFHNSSSATADTVIYVYKKPTATVSTTYITLGNLDSRCTYTIDGKAGTPIYEGENIVGYRFTGLTPNTQYQIVAKGQAMGSEANVAYAYIYATTLPVYTGKVRVMLNGSYDSATHEALTGTPVNIEQVVSGLGNNASIYLKNSANASAQYIELPRTSTGEYSATLDNGSYNIYLKKNGSYQLADDQLIVMNDDNRTRYLFYYSVTYTDDNGIKLASKDVEYYHNTHAVDLWMNEIEMPTKDGYIFIGWQDQDGNDYLLPQYGGTETQLTSSISKEYILKPLWTKKVNVYVDIELDHVNGLSHNIEFDTLNQISFSLMQRRTQAGNYTHIGSTAVDWTFNPTDADFENAQFVGLYEGDNPNVPDKTKYIAKSPDAKTQGFISAGTAISPTFVTSEYYGGYFTIDLNKKNYVVVDEDNNPANGYSGITVRTSPATGDVYITAKMQYAPNEFELSYSVTIKEDDVDLYESLPANLKPIAANVKVTTWYDTPYDNTEDMGWHTITQHHEMFERVELLNAGESYSGSGTYAVWKDAGSGDPYLYRIEIVSYELMNGTIVLAEDAGDHIEYISDGGRYIASVHVDNGGNIPSGQPADAIKGAYWDVSSPLNPKQNGTLHAVIDIKAYDITFDANGGTFSDDTTQKTVLKQIVVPNLSGYTVTRKDAEGEYAFDGWYIVKNGAMTDQKLVSGAELTEDITVRAKWKPPVTIKGTVTIAGFYYLNGQKFDIYSHDRAKTVKAVLQQIQPNGYAVTIAEQDVALTGTSSGDYGVGNYSFEGYINDGRTYRVLLNATNYTAEYQNEPESITNSDKYNTYTNKVEDATAIFVSAADTSEEDKNTAVVNIYGHFEPTSFNLQYRTDATPIAEAYRPELAEVLVLYYDYAPEINYNYPQQWKPISQMVDGSSHTGQDTTSVFATEGAETQSYSVWNHHTDGHSLYDYAIKVESYIPYHGTVKQDYSVDAPFTIVYNLGSARYDAASTGMTQTQQLTATFHPRRYVIDYELNNEAGTVTGMESYPTEFTWSYGVVLPTEKPQLEGHTFKGWKEVLDTKNTADLSDDVLSVDYVTEIPADRHQDITLRAIWEKNTYAYTVKYFYNGIEDTALSFSGEAAYGTEIEVTANQLDINDKDIYQLDSVRYSDVVGKHAIIIGTSASSNVLEIHYANADNVPYTVRYFRQKMDDPNSYEELTMLNHQHTGVANSIVSAHIEEYGENYTGVRKDYLNGYVINLERSTSHTEGATTYYYSVKLDSANEEIHLYYDLANYDYSVEYYYGGELDQSNTVTNSATYGITIDTYENKIKDGYQTTPYRVDGITVSTDSKKNVVKVYYAPRYDIPYLIAYYRENDSSTPGNIQYDKVYETTYNNGIFNEIITVEPEQYGDSYSDEQLKTVLAGYVLDKTNPQLDQGQVSLKLTTGTNVIKIYYKRNTYSYRVQYYYGGQLDASATETGLSALYKEQVSTYTNKPKEGYQETPYLVESTEIGTDPDQNIVKVYYAPRTDVPYQIEYYRENRYGEYNLVYTDTSAGLIGTYGQTISVTPHPVGAYYSGELGSLLTGYVYTTTSNTVTSAVLTMPDNGTKTTLKLYFNRAGYGYSIEYYKDTETEPFYTQSRETALFGTTVSATQQDIEAHKPTGYKFDRKQDATITVDSAANVVKVYYVKDASQVHTLSYTVNHTILGNATPSSSTLYKDETVWINTNVLKIQSGSLDPLQTLLDIGYKVDSISMNVHEGDLVSDKTVITITYIPDSAQTHTISYTVVHRLFLTENYETETPTLVGEPLTYSETVQKLTTTIPVSASSIAHQNITGYKPYPNHGVEYVSGVTDGQAQNGAKIYVNYIKDESQTKTIKFYVKHVLVDGETAKIDDASTVEYTGPAWVLEDPAYTMITNEVDLSLNEYVGYTFSSISPNVQVGDLVEENEIIYIVYRKDLGKTKNYSYTVQHKVDGTILDEHTRTYYVPIWAGAADDATIPVNNSHIAPLSFIGYKHAGYENTDITVSSDNKVQNNTVITLIYDKDQSQNQDKSYTVKHFKAVYRIEGGSEVFDSWALESEQTHTVNVWINATTIPVVQNSLAVKDFTGIGYKFSHTNRDVAVTELPVGAVVEFYYAKDQSATKDILYVVEHKIGDVVQESKEHKITIHMSETSAHVIASTVNKNFYPGYTLSSIVKNGTDTLTEATVKDAQVAYHDSGTKDVITFTYVKDEAQTKTLGYDVVYQKNNQGTITPLETVEKRTTAWINNPDTLVVTEDSLTEKTYTGYLLDSITLNGSKTTLEALKGQTVPTNSKIVFTYVPDHSSVVGLKYTVKHIIQISDSIQTLKETLEYKEDVWTGISSMGIMVQPGSLDARYHGYKIHEVKRVDGTNRYNVQVGDMIADNSIIEVIYVKDESKTAEFKYTVRHVLGSVVDKSTEYSAGNLWVNTTLIPVAEANIQPLADYYKAKGYVPSGVVDGIIVENSTKYVSTVYPIVEINYVKDYSPEAYNHYKYTVRHVVFDGTNYVDLNEAGETFTHTYTVPVHKSEEKLQIQTGTLESLTFTGYKFKEIVDGYAEGNYVADNTVIYLLYEEDYSQIKKLSYTVKHMVGGTVKDVKVTEKEVWVLSSEDTLEVKAEDIAPNSYSGYIYNYMDPKLKANDLVENGTTIKLHYIDTEYTVRHWVCNDAGIYLLADSETIKNVPVGNTVTAIEKTYQDYILNTQKTESMSGVVDAENRLVLNLYYDKDVIGNNDQPDGIPDKYQMKVEYKAIALDTEHNEVPGKAEVSISHEVVTIVDADNKWAETGTAKTTGTEVINIDGNWRMVKWTDKPYVNETNDVITTNALLESQTITDATAGLSKTYTAYLHKKPADYKVVHYKWNTEQNAYVEAESSVISSVVETQVSTSAKDYDGYTFNAEKSTVEGVVTLPSTNGVGLVLELYYDVDTNDDDIADKHQVLIKYVANPEGAAQLEKTEEYLNIQPTLLQRLLGATTAPILNGSITVDGPSFSMHGDYEFVGWTDETGSNVTFPLVLRDVNAGETYVFTAHFKKKEIVPAPTPDTPVVEKPAAPNTSDDSELMGWALTSMLSLILAIFATLERKRKLMK